MLQIWFLIAVFIIQFSAKAKKSSGHTLKSFTSKIVQCHVTVVYQVMSESVARTLPILVGSAAECTVTAY